MTEFNLERLMADLNAGRVRRADILLDKAHDGKPEEIDLHVMFDDQNGKKYKGLSGVEEFRENFGYVQPGGTVSLGGFGGGSMGGSGGGY